MPSLFLASLPSSADLILYVFKGHDQGHPPSLDQPLPSPLVPHIPLDMLYALSVNYVYAYTRGSVPVVSGLKDREDSLFILNFIHLSVVFFILPLYLFCIFWLFFHLFLLSVITVPCAWQIINVKLTIVF